MSDELTFNPSDNDVAPDGPIKLEMECDSTIIYRPYPTINSFPGPTE